MTKPARIIFIFLISLSLFLSIYAIATVVGLRTEINQFEKTVDSFDSALEQSVAIASSQEELINTAERNNVELSAIIKSELEQKFVGLDKSEPASALESDKSEWVKHTLSDSSLAFIHPPDSEISMLQNGDISVVLNDGNVLISKRKKIDEYCEEENCIDIVAHTDWLDLSIFPGNRISRYEELIKSFYDDSAYFRLDYTTEEGDTYIIDGYYDTFEGRDIIRSILLSMNFDN